MGCDHGYCTQFMLENGLCERATVTDVSAPSLKKAETLLKEYFKAGKCSSVVCDGLSGVPRSVDLVLIAGMGGREIVHILKDGFIPERFVLQPMRDGEAVRELLLTSGAVIERDFTFFAEGKFYDVIAGRSHGHGQIPQAYSKAEMEFGRENIQEGVRSPESDFSLFLRERIKKQKDVLTRPLKGESKERALERLQYLEGVLNGEIK